MKQERTFNLQSKMYTISYQGYRKQLQTGLFFSEITPTYTYFCYSYVKSPEDFMHDKTCCNTWQPDFLSGCCLTSGEGMNMSDIM